MDLAGLNIVMDADFSSVFSSFAQANTMAQNFVTNLKNAFNGIPDLGRRLNFTSNGASQAIQDSREAARAAREQAAADLDRAKAADIAERAQQRANRTNSAGKDEYAQLVASNQALVREYYNAAASIIRYGDAAGISADRLEELRVAAQRGQQQLSQIEQGAGRFQRQVGNYAVGTAALAQQLRQITTEIPNFFISARIGFQSLSNNLPGIFNELTRIREANQALAATGQPTVSVFKQFLSAFNPLNIAIGVGVGLLTAYGPELIEMTKGLFAGSEAAQRAAKAQEAYNKATDEATKTATASAIKEQANADVLYAATQNVTLSYDQRKYAAKELIALAPFIFKGLSEEAIVAGKAEEAYKKLTEAIKDKIAVAVNEKQAESILMELTAAKDLVDKDKELLGIRKQINDINKKNQDLEKSRPKGSSTGYSQADLALITSINSQQKQLRTTQNDLFNQAKNLSGKTFFVGDNSLFPDTDKAIGHLKEYYDVYRKYGIKINDINAIRANVDELFQPVDKPKKPPKTKDYTEQLENAKQDVADAWYNIQQADKKGAEDWLKSHDSDEQAFKPSFFIDDSGQITAAFGANAKAIQDGIDNEGLLQSIRVDQWQKEADDIKAAQDKQTQITAAFWKGIVDQLKQGLADTATALGEGIGNMFAGVDDPFSGLLSVLANNLKSLGKQLITYGLSLTALWKAIEGLSKLGPVGGIVAVGAGVAAIAAGEYMEAQMSKSASKKLPLAAGALAYGPTNALIGEYANARSNPEVVAPLDKLQTILKNSGGGNQSSVFIPEMTIKGQDLLVVFKRAEKGYQR